MKKMKVSRIIALFLCVVLFQGILGSGAFSATVLADTEQNLQTDDNQTETDGFVAEGEYGSNLTWTLDADGVLTITGSGAMYDYEWYQKSKSPFEPIRASVNTIVLDSRITTIGECAFYYFQNLKSINLPEGLTEIKANAFYYCYGLETISIPESVKKIGNYAFFHCNKLINIEVKDGLEIIGDYAFEECSFTTFAFSDSLKEIGEFAFYICKNLTHAYIGPQVSVIGSRAFAKCTKLSEIELSEGLQKIDDLAFHQCPITTIQLPDTLNTIGARAFDECKSLTEVVIPDSVTTIGQSAFAHCSALVSVKLPDNLTQINASLFLACPVLTDINIPETVTVIGDKAFASCSSLNRVILPDSVTSIGQSAFSSCTGLMEMELPSSLSSISESVFNGCTGLEVIAVPDGVTSIGKTAFSGCSNLASITIPQSVTNIASTAFGSLTAFEIWGYAGSTAESFALEHSYTFKVICTEHQLIKVPAVDYTCMEDGNIEYWTCEVCGKMFNDENASVEISPSSIVVPASHRWDAGTVIAQNQDATVRVVKHNCTVCNETCEETVLSDNLLDGGLYGEGFFWCVDANWVLQIDGNGAMPEMKTSEYPWYQIRSNIQGVEIKDGITSISPYAFAHFSSLKEVSFPDSLISIDSYAFSYCYGLESVSIPSSVKELVFATFYECHGLKTVELHKGLETIGGYCFYKCGDLNNIVIPESVRSFDQQAFRDCTSLESAVIPYGVTVIPLYLFVNCTNLKTVTIPVTVKAIDEGFTNSGLTDVYYLGTERQWNNIDIDYSTDDALSNATIHFIENPESVSIIGSDELIEGERAQLHAMYERGLDYFITEYSSSDPNIASVDADGIVYAWNEGQVVITGSFEDADVQDSFILTVKRKNIDDKIATALFSEGTVTDNLNKNNLYNGGVIVTSYLTQVDEDTLMRVEAMKDGHILVEYVDTKGEVLDSLSVDGELSFFGGFYSGEYYYLAFAQNNPDEDNSVEVLRIVQYDKNWNRLKACSIRGVNTCGALAGGLLRMDSSEGILYIHTCHTMYVNPADGINHEANLTFEINESDMTLKDGYSGVANITNGYVSHSFNQFIKVYNGNVYRVDQGDGYPRGISFTVYPVTGSMTSPYLYKNIFSFYGAIGQNYTGATVGGFELSNKYGLVAFSYDKVYTKGPKNIYLSAVDLKTGESEAIQITNYSSDDNITCSTPQLVKISDWQFLLMWTESNSNTNETTAVLAKLDYSGKIIGEKIYNKDLQFSDCQPILLSDGSVSWYVSGRGMLKYYNIDPYHLDENNAHLVREYLITFIDEDGTVLQSEKAEEGTTPVFHGDKPKKDPNQQYIYEFDKWTPEIASVTGNITYQATYKSSLRKYAVTWLNEDGTVLETSEVEYGKTPAYSGTTPSKESAGEVTYVFTGWTPAIVPVTGTATYTATFKEATIDDIVKDLDNGWHEINSNWYYVESGKLVKGWKQSGSTWYYMDPETGVMQTGLQEIKGSKYIFANSGAMRTGWIDLDGTWYYAQASGTLATGWLQSGSTWYYMNPATCEMATGWVKVGSSWYYMNPSGAMATGWVKDGDTWYYMNSSGAMVTGWVKVGSTWYYMKANGAMAASEWVPGYYWISASGAWTYQPVGSWKQNSTGWWFGDTSGWYAKNETIKINDVLYTFNAAGYWVK